MMKETDGLKHTIGLIQAGVLTLILVTVWKLVSWQLAILCFGVSMYLSQLLGRAYEKSDLNKKCLKG